MIYLLLFPKKTIPKFRGTDRKNAALKVGASYRQRNGKQPFTPISLFNQKIPEALKLCPLLAIRHRDSGS